MCMWKQLPIQVLRHRIAILSPVHRLCDFSLSDLKHWTLGRKSEERQSVLFEVLRSELDCTVYLSSLELSLGLLLGWHHADIKPSTWDNGRRKREDVRVWGLFESEWDFGTPSTYTSVSFCPSAGSASPFSQRSGLYTFTLGNTRRLLWPDWTLGVLHQALTFIVGMHMKELDRNSL